MVKRAHKRFPRDSLIQTASTFLREYVLGAVLFLAKAEFHFSVLYFTAFNESETLKMIK